MRGGLPILYRLVRAEQANEADFHSMMILGIRAPTDTEREQPEIWAGLSMFNTEAAARRRAKRFKRLPQWIAKIEGLDPDWVVIGTPDEDGHHTVWGRPGRLLAAVHSIVQA